MDRATPDQPTMSWLRVLLAVLLVFGIAMPCGSALAQCPEPPGEEDNTEDNVENPDATPEPIVLADGSVTETVTDVTLPGVTLGWSHTRSYSSRLQRGAKIQGESWKASWFTVFLRQEDGSENIELYLNHVSKRVFKESGGSFTAPDEFLATLTAVTSGGKGYYELQFTQTGRKFTFYDLGDDWPDAQKGLLASHTDRYGTEAITYGYDGDAPGGRITSVTTTQGWAVEYSYITTGTNVGKVRKIDVKNGSDQVIQRVRYTYYKSGQGYSSDCGSDGDLIMVKVLKRATANDLTDSSDAAFFIERITMYRYYKSDDYHGGAHQLKMVLGAASVEEANGSKTVAQLLNLADNGIVTGSVTLQDYANVTYKYYTVPFDTSDVDGENLQTKYGGSNFNETGFAKSQTVRKDYKGYLGTRTYFYMNNSVEEDLNAVQRIVVEDHTEAGTRKIYGLNKDRLTLREIFVDDPDGTPKYWCQSFVRGETKDGNTNNVNKVTEKRMPSAHTCITDDDEVTAFLDVQDSWTSGSTINADSGVVYRYDYNADGYLTKERIKQGNLAVDTATYLRVVEYGDGAANRPKYLPWRTYVYHTATTTEDTEPAHSHSFKITTTYAFHDPDPGDEQQMKEKTVSREAIIGPSQNGSGVEVETKEYYDDRGRLRWTQDGEGHVIYYSYHQYTGGLGYRMVDVETDSLPGDITSGNTPKWIAWGNDPAPFTHDADSLQLVTKYEFDGLGRPTRVEDAEGMVTATAYCNNETRVYPGWDSTATPKAALPIRVEKVNDDNLTTQMYTVDPDGLTTIPDSGGLPTGVDTGETQEDYLTWTRYAYDDDHSGDATCLLQTVDRYHDIPNDDGTLSTHYYRTFYKYDTTGRRTHTIKVVSGTDATGLTGCVEQVTRTTYDDLGRVTSVERGVSSSAHVMKTSVIYDNDPTLLPVSQQWYDESTPGTHNTAGVGDSLVTSTCAYYDDNNEEDDTNAVKTAYWHNWRGQLRGIEPETAPYTVQDVDNLGRAKAVARFTSTSNFGGTNWTTVLGNDNYAADATDSNRRTLTKTHYDEQGRLYRTEVYAVDPADGDPDDKAVANRYYDRNSRLAATTSPAQGGVEYAYDGAGRRAEVRMVKELKDPEYSSGVFQYRDPQPGASSGGNDGVIQITRTTYDATGNVTDTFTLEADHVKSDGTTINNDGISLDDGDYVQTALYNWYDAVGRLTTKAYAGAGSSTETSWKHGSVVTRPGTPPTASTADLLVTTYDYNSAGRLETVTDPRDKETTYLYDDLGRKRYVAENWTNFSLDANGDPQYTGGTDTSEDRVTEFTYDGLSNVLTQVALDPDADGDTADKQETIYLYEDFYDATLVTNVIYPDSSDSDSTGTDQVKFTYDLDGRVKTRTDQKTGEDANVITFAYDVTLRRLETQGVTTLGTGVDDFVLGIKTTYDTSLGRVWKVTSWSDSACTATVQNEVLYEYDHLGRLDKEYQEHEGEVDDNTTLYGQYTYAAASGGEYADGLRLASVRYPDSRLVHYTYGADASLADEISRLDAIKADDPNDPGNPGDTLASYQYNGLARLVVEDFAQPDVRLDYYDDYVDAATPGTYEGLDRFGRIKQQVWRDYDAGSYVDHYTYAYDYNSNRLYRKNELESTLGELYHANGASAQAAYDGLNRLKEFRRGTLNVNKDSITSDDDRRQVFTLDQVGNWDGFQDDAGDGSTWDLDQTRDQNDANEITDITEGDGQSAWADPAYSARGNMTGVPKPTALTTTYTCKYDAWNRLVEVKSGETVVAKYEYDGLSRRVKKHIDTDETPGVDTYRHFYYNAGWQILETRKATNEPTEPETLDPEFQYVWSLRYIDAAVLRDENKDDDDDCIDGQDERLYYTTDANMNVTALVNDVGTVVERVVYDPYGKPKFYDQNWANPSDSSSYDNSILYCGYYHDWETGLYHVRNRVYHDRLGWLQRDPIGYADGMSLYEYVGSNPAGLRDAMGLLSPLPGALGQDFSGDDAGGNTEKSSVDKIMDDFKSGEIGSMEELHRRAQSLTPEQKYELIGRLSEKYGDPTGLIGRVVSGGDDWAGEYGQNFSWSAFVAKEIVAQVGNTLVNTLADIVMPSRRVERAMDDYLADRARGESELDALLIAAAKNVPLMAAGWGLGEAWEGRTRGGVDHRRRLNTGERVGRVGGFIATEAALLAVALKITGNNPTLFDTRGASGGGRLEWVGSGPPESGKGSWPYPATKEVFRGHMDSIKHGPHWDWRAPPPPGASRGSWYRVYPGGTIEPK